MILWFAWPEFYSMHAWCHRALSANQRTSPHPLALASVFWPAHCEWKILCLHKKLDFCISYGNEKTSTWFVFHWFTRSTPSFYLLPPTAAHFRIPTNFFLECICAGQKKTVLATLGKLFEFPSFIFGFLSVFFLVVAFHWFLVLCICSLGFCGSWTHARADFEDDWPWSGDRAEAGESQKTELYSGLMLIRFGSWINPIAKWLPGVGTELEQAFCMFTSRLSLSLAVFCCGAV